MFRLTRPKQEAFDDTVKAWWNHHRLVLAFESEFDDELLLDPMCVERDLISL